ncbi:MAG: VWA domain-containing protein [Thermodesulfobacteriota bacterium]
MGSSIKFSVAVFFLVFMLVVGQESLLAMPSASTTNTKEAPVRWDVELGNPYVQQGPYADQLLNIKLSGRNNIPLLIRTPVNLVLVIDKSGSMSDRGKIDYAKQAAKEIINRLGNNDRLSIVAYSTEVEVLYPMQFLRNKSHAVSAVDSIYPTNSTNLSGGLITGINQLESATRSGYINRVILLSDGLANAGITDIGELSRISSQASERNTHITTMGLGLDYDENLMMSLAQHGAGNYYFIESPSQLASIFQREFGQLSRMIAKSSVLTLSLEPGVTLSKVYGYKYSKTKDGKVRIKLGDMFAGQQRDILLKLRIPAEKIGEKGLLKAYLNYEDLLNANKSTGFEKELSYIVTSDKQRIKTAENKEVTARGVSVDAASNLHKATTEYESGNSAGALSYMNDAYQKIVRVNQTPERNPQTLKQEEELREAIEDIEMNAPSPMSDDGKKLIKEQKAKALGYQQ